MLHGNAPFKKKGIIGSTKKYEKNEEEGKKGKEGNWERKSYRPLQQDSDSKKNIYYKKNPKKKRKTNLTKKTYDMEGGGGEKTNTLKIRLPTLTQM